MANAWEDLKIMRDETMIDKDRKYVAIHHPDGVPDLLQQIEHGALALIAQHHAFGFAITGIVQPNLWQYNMIGDAVNLTDGLIYNPDLKPFHRDESTSGTMDDRWAFTNFSPETNIQSAIALTAAGRALKSYNDNLAAECLETAKRVWDKEVAYKIENQTFNEIKSTVELLLSTDDKKYAEYL